jgi:hypothetical protein
MRMVGDHEELKTAEAKRVTFTPKHRKFYID